MCGIEAAKITLEELLIVICVSGVFWLTLVQLNIFLLAESVIEACVWHTQSVWHWKLFIRGSSWTCWGCCAWTVSYAVFLRTVLLFSVVCDLLLLSCWVVSDSVAPCFLLFGQVGMDCCLNLTEMGSSATSCQLSVELMSLFLGSPISFLLDFLF